MRKILVSECLYGEKVVRYDGGIKAESNPIFLKWKEEGRLVTVCPEVFGGLPTPRADSQRKDDKVISRVGTDVTSEYRKGANEALRLAREHDVAFAVMKERSPSCGVNEIYDGTFEGIIVPGMGMATETLQDAGFKAFSEKELDKALKYLNEIEK